VLGKIISVDFQEMLDIYHGASYYRCWHRLMKYSGSLWSHKASYHFDKMNWILDTEPESVQAFGDLKFYGKNSDFRCRNCCDCNFTKKCQFYMDINKDKTLKELYVDNENADGYLRDGCVFENNIDIYDTMQANIKYKNGVVMSYSLDSYMPYEGQKISIKGNKAGIDLIENSRQPWNAPASYGLRLTENFGKTKTWMVNNNPNTDNKMRAMIFEKDSTDTLNQKAGSRAGVLNRYWCQKIDRNRKSD